MIRDKNATQQKLIDAVGKVILNKGFSSIGINTIAKEASVDKVLIYRYFNGLDELLKAYVAQKDYFSNISELLGDKKQILTKEDAQLFGKELLKGQLRNILENKEFQEILIWELTTITPVTESVADNREKQGVAILNKLRKKIGKTEADIPAIASIISAGIYYLALRSRQVKVFNGIDFKSKRGWKRIEKSVDFLIDKSLK